MKKAVWSGLLAVTALLMMSTPALAQANDTAAINVTVNVNARAKLTLGTAAITWADADPDVTPTLSSGAITVDVKARTSAGSSVALTVVASDDLKAGTNVITIDNLTWTGTGANFAANGTSNKTTSQNVVSFTNSGSHSGTQTYSLPNSWSYATGAYTATLNYTLVAP
jgi:hypothetical protein